jgi:DNA-directed RNA polymerase
MDEQRFQRQLALEEKYQSLGYSKVIKGDQQNKERGYGSHTVFGNIIRRELVGFLGEALKLEFSEICAGKAGVGSATIKQTFADQSIDWTRVSHIGLVTLLDCVFFTHDTVSSTHLKMGQRIEDELMLRFFKQANPDTYTHCEKHYMRPTASYRQKVYSTKKIFKEEGKKRAKDFGHEDAELVTWHQWPQSTKHMVGSWITAMADVVFNRLTNLHFLDKRVVASKSGKSRDFAYRIHDDIRDVETNQQVLAGLKASYEDNPMVCPPIDWSLDSSGGFVTNRVTHRYPLVRGDGSTIPSQTALDALNQLQRTAWKINPFVLEQLNYFYERGESVNKSDPFKPFKHPDPHDIPKLPPHLTKLPEGASEELIKERNTELRKLNDWYNALADRRKNGRIHMMVYSAANQFAKEDRIWMPWTFDFRTRMYPISILNPQSGNHVSALLQFADGYPVDDRSRYWLSVHVATTKGFSKETFEGRVAWVEANLKEITAVATDPLGRGRQFWTEGADEPWTYLAACREFWECFIAKTKTVTNIPCGIDATASGLQILGALMGDEATCNLVNVLPTRKPADLYQTVIDKTIKLIKDDRPRRRGLKLEELSRSVAKAPTMTLAYGSTEWRRKSQIWDACNGKRGLELGLPWEKIEYIAKKMDEAIAMVLPGVTFMLGWLQSTAVRSMQKDKTKLMVTWSTPSGCEIHQRYFESKISKVKTIALGMTKYSQARTYEEGDKPNYSKVESSTAANFTHSMDAAIMQLVACRAEMPLSMTHDCVYGRAGEDMDWLARAIREEFITVVSSDVLDQFAACNGVPEEIESVNRNRNSTFKYKRILQSRFLFC